MEVSVAGEAELASLRSSFSTAVLCLQGLCINTAKLFVGNSLCVKKYCVCVCVHDDKHVDTHAEVGSLLHNMDSWNQIQVAGLCSH